MFMQAISAVAISAVSVLGACAPAVPVPTVTPCDGTNLIIHGFDATTGCDLTPPQVLSVTEEHTVPWSQDQADMFRLQCDRHGGVVSDDVGEAWVCFGIDY